MENTLECKYIFINLKVPKNEFIPFDVLELNEKALVWFYIIAFCGPQTL